MKILIVSTFERRGGAAIAAYRLMQALCKSGVDAKMLVRDRQSSDPQVVSVNTTLLRRAVNFLRFAWERWLIFAANGFSRKGLFAVSLANTGTNISRHPLVKQADILHLHWINQGFLSLKNIRQLQKTGKPLVWTMHDMWVGTGICHYVANSRANPHFFGSGNDCDKYRSQCGNCPLLGKPSPRDWAQKIFDIKKRLSTKIAYVGCSKWIAECARNSALLRDSRITSIPNPIDIEVFSPKDKKGSRQHFGLPQDKKLVLFAAVSMADFRKGLRYFVDACKLLAQRDVEIALMGGRIDEELLRAMPLPAHVMGYLSSEEEIAMAYSAADIFVTPSLSENLPNTIMEAMACGIPCVGFNVGGIPEMIVHQENGFVARYHSAEDLAQGMEYLLFEADYGGFSHRARLSVVERYAEMVVAAQYFDLYKKTLPLLVRYHLN